jgi:crotonobetainyl-CoA:carnitine CoA-transferase CaiB-like acyl-CoA transferase
MESLLDFQFELLTTYYASRELPKRSAENNAHPLLSAPYGIYATEDGFIAIAMVNIQQLAAALSSDSLLAFSQEDTFVCRDEIKNIISRHVTTASSAHWIEKLHGNNVWAMEVLDWHKIMQHPAYQILQMEQIITTGTGKEIITTRCPIRINGERLFSQKPAPELGADNRKIIESLTLKTDA